MLQDNLVLGGRILEKIGNLKLHTLLTLDENSFDGPIPSSLGNMESLGITRSIISSETNFILNEEVVLKIV